MKFLGVFVVAVFISTVYGDTCNNPTVKSNVYAATDGTIMDNIACIVEFTVTCQNGPQNLILYADVKGKIIPSMRSSDHSKYQVSWVDPVDKVSSGSFPVRFYDEDGFATLRKAQRSGEDSSTIKPLFTIDVNHPGTYKGPWIQSEYLATGVVVVLWYLAYSAKSRIQA